MNIVLDSNIDEELKYLLASTATLSKGKKLIDKDIKNILNDFFIDLITPIISNNYSLNFKKTRNLLHIILYNYNYAKMVDDYVFEELNFEHMVEDLSADELLLEITSNNNLIYYLTQKYFYIILNDDLKEMLDDNEDVYNNVNWISDWYLFIDNNYELITTKISHMLFDIRDYCDITETSLKDEILLKFLYENEDYFNITKEYFNSFQEFNSYKFLLCQMLYLDSYYYLQTEKRKRKLNLFEEFLNTYLEEHIKMGKINELPNGKLTTLKLLDYFFLVNEDKITFKKNNCEELPQIQQIINKKASKILLLEYC